jgi:hypothetical protein
MKPADQILKNQQEVLTFLRSRFPMYHLSNFFFRDVEFGIRAFLEAKGVKIGYTEAQSIARQFTESLEQAKIFRPIDRQSWVVNYPEFKTVSSKPPAAAKPAPAAAPVPAQASAIAGTAQKATV